jgi:hypothetical protein
MESLARFPLSTECYKRAFVGTSAHPYFISYTCQQVRCYISSYIPQVCKVAGRQSWKSQSKGTMQATFVMASRENGSAGLIWDIGEALMVGESRT